MLGICFCWNFGFVESVECFKWFFVCNLIYSVVSEFINVNMGYGVLIGFKYLFKKKKKWKNNCYKYFVVYF